MIDNQTISNPTVAVEEPAPIVPKGNSLFANTTWTLVGNITYSGCQFFWLLLLANVVKDNSTSLFILAMSIITPLLVFTGLGLRYVLATDTRGEFSFTEYMLLRLIMSFVSMVVIVLIALTGQAFHQYAVSGTLVICSVGAAKCIEANSEIIFGQFLNRERLDLIGLSMMLKGLLSLVGMGIGAYLTKTALGGALGLACAWLGVLFWFDLPQVFGLSGMKMNAGNVGNYYSVFKERTRSINELLPRMIQLGKRSAPLAFAAGIYTLNPNIVSYFAFPCLGASRYKIFGILQYMTLPGQMIVTSIGLALTPRLARAYADGKHHDFRKQLTRMAALVAGMGMVGIAISFTAGHWILSKLFPPEYADYANTLGWLFVAASISYLAGLLGYASTATRTFHRFAVPYTAVTLVALAVSALCVPPMGMLGGAIAYGAIYLAAAVAFLTILAQAGVFGSARSPVVAATAQTSGSNS